MQNINLAIRQAVLNAINPVIYQGKNIYAYNDKVMLSASKPAVYLDIPNSSNKVQAYIIILNQNSNNNDQNKDNRNDQASIQLQITTRFVSGTGERKQNDEITQLVLNKLYPNGNKRMSVVLPDGLNLWKCYLEINKPLPALIDDTATVYITQLVISCQVSQ